MTSCGTWANFVAMAVDGSRSQIVHVSASGSNAGWQSAPAYTRWLVTGSVVIPSALPGSPRAESVPCHSSCAPVSAFSRYTPAEELE